MLLAKSSSDSWLKGYNLCFALFSLNKEGLLFKNIRNSKDSKPITAKIAYDHTKEASTGTTSIGQDYNDTDISRCDENTISKQIILKRPQLVANLYMSRLVNSNAQHYTNTHKIRHIWA